MNNPRRKDRVGEHRTAFEKNRQIILQTQTVCGICGKPVDFSFRFPHPLSPTVDHIIPVAKGGHPSDLSNLQLAHRACNRWKSDKMFVVQRQKQMEGEKKETKSLPLHYDWTAYKADTG